MKLESYATPHSETPQQRYARLHRAVECGLASDDIWKQLADVCLRLGRGDEAVRCMRRISGPTMRFALASRLARLGLIEAQPEAFQRAHPHAAAPAASDAGAGPGPRPVATTANDHSEHRLTDHVIDAFQFLLRQHMPWLVLISTLAFPGVIGVGGFLTAGGSWLLLAAMAALPGLCVLATVGAVGRQVLLTSAEGHEVEGLPGFHRLVVDACRFLVDAGLVLGSLLGPSLVALWLGVPLLTALPGLVIGALVVPMAWVLRQLRGDYAALSPVVLMRAIVRTRDSYLGLAAITVGMFLPAAAVMYAVSGRPLWVQIAVIGPLCVLPVFVASRLLGTWVDAQRHRLGNLLHRERQLPTALPPVAPPPAAAPVAATKPTRPAAVRPAAAPASKTTAATRVAGPSAPPPGTRRQAQRKAPPPPTAIRAKPPAAPAAPAPAARPAVAAPAKPTNPAPARTAPCAIEGRGPSRRQGDAPVLHHMPGAVVVKGAERRRHGAAAKRP